MNQKLILYFLLFFFLDAPSSTGLELQNNQKESQISQLNYLNQNQDTMNSKENSQELKLRLNSSLIETNELMNLLEFQDQSLENLEVQWNLLVQQLQILKKINEELEIQLQDSLKNIMNLQDSLMEAQNEVLEIKDYNNDLYIRLAEANRLKRSASISGVISGTVLGVGLSMLVIGCVNNNEPVLYTGTGIALGSVAIWTTGKLAKWW